MGPTITWTLAQTAPADGAPADAAPTDAAPDDAAPLSAANPDAASTQAPGAPANDVPPTAADSPSIEFFWLIILGAIIFMFAMSWLTNRKERTKRTEMLSKLSKGDEVQMVGGERGKVVELREDEVVLKVDENSNTRIRFARAAIQTVLSESKGS